MNISSCVITGLSVGDFIDVLIGRLWPNGDPNGDFIGDFTKRLVSDIIGLVIGVRAGDFACPLFTVLLSCTSA